MSAYALSNGANETPATHDNVNDGEAERSSHEAATAAKLVDNGRTNNGADNTNGVQASCKTALRDRRVTGLREEDGRVGGDGLREESAQSRSVSSRGGAGGQGSP